MDKTIVRKLDDVEAQKGHEYDATYHGRELEFEGTRVSLDLGDANYGTLVEALKPYLAAGTPVSSRRSGGAKKASSGGAPKARTASSGRAKSQDSRKAEFNDEVRGWAKRHRPDLKVAEKGRISDQVLNLYKEEHPDWEKTWFMDQADDSAPAAPQPSAPVTDTDQFEDNEPSGGAHRVDDGGVDEHGWSTEAPQQYTGVGSYS